MVPQGISDLGYQCFVVFTGVDGPEVSDSDGQQHMIIDLVSYLSGYFQ